MIEHREGASSSEVEGGESLNEFVDGLEGLGVEVIKKSAQEPSSEGDRVDRALAVPGTEVISATLILLPWMKKIAESVDWEGALAKGWKFMTESVHFKDGKVSLKINENVEIDRKDLKGGLETVKGYIRRFRKGKGKEEGEGKGKDEESKDLSELKPDEDAGSLEKEMFDRLRSLEIVPALLKKGSEVIESTEFLDAETKKALKIELLRSALGLK